MIRPLLAALACQTLSPTPGPTTGEFKGFYINGFEVSSFVPCDMVDDLAQGTGYWLNGISEMSDQYYALVQSSGFDQGTGYLSVYVRFNGELSPPGGGYGHLGAYEREVTVTKLLEMSLDGQCSNN